MLAPGSYRAEMNLEAYYDRDYSHHVGNIGVRVAIQLAFQKAASEVQLQDGRLPVTYHVGHLNLINPWLSAHGDLIFHYRLRFE